MSTTAQRLAAVEAALKEIRSVQNEVLRRIGTLEQQGRGVIPPPPDPRQISLKFGGG